MQHPTRGHSPYSLREWPARHTTLSIVPRSSKLGEPSSASRYSERILFRGTAGAVCERGSEQRYEPSSAEYRPAVDGGGEQEGSFGILWRSTRAASLASGVYRLSEAGAIADEGCAQGWWVPVFRIQRQHAFGIPISIIQHHSPATRAAGPEGRHPSFAFLHGWRTNRSRVFGEGNPADGTNLPM